jgi:hypothetical protein
MKEQARLAAEKRGVTTLRYQKWESGKGGQQVRDNSLEFPYFLLHGLGSRHARFSSLQLSSYDSPHSPSDRFTLY